MRADILGVERRRRWSSDEKARILEATFAPGAKVAEVARRHDVAASVLFAWRRQSKVAGTTAVEPFVPIAVRTTPTVASRRTGRDAGRASKGVIEIDLGGGRRLKVDADVDAAALARVLDVLERR